MKKTVPPNVLRFIPYSFMCVSEDTYLGPVTVYWFCLFKVVLQLVG